MADAVRCPGCKQTVIPVRVPAFQDTVLFETNPTWVLLAETGSGDKVVQGCVPHQCAHPTNRERAKPYLHKE
jgi:hypothetical protein